MSPTRSFVTIVSLLAGTALAASPLLAQEEEPPMPARQTIAAGAWGLVPSDPLDAGSGVAASYRYAPARTGWYARAIVGLGLFDRSAEGETREGELSLLRVGGGLGWPLWQGGGWRIDLFGGLDVYIPDAEGDYEIGPPLGVENDYEADTGFGGHLGAGFRRQLAGRWGVEIEAALLAASLDGEHVFVIEGVESDSIEVDFDLTGPSVTVLVSYRLAGAIFPEEQP
jgi:hypothetical protein